MILNGTFTNLFGDCGYIPSLFISLACKWIVMYPERSTIVIFDGITFHILWDGISMVWL